MEEERPGEEPADHGPLSRAVDAAIRGNSTAFGFSITITVTFGVVQRSEGTGTVLECLLFGIAAALAVSVVSGLVTRGFRDRVRDVVPEVMLLGTAQDFLSIGAGVGAAAATAAVLDGVAAWTASGAVAVVAFIAVESLEFLIAERVQRLRGDREAGRHDGDG